MAVMAFTLCNIYPQLHMYHDKVHVCGSIGVAMHVPNHMHKHACVMYVRTYMLCSHTYMPCSMLIKRQGSCFIATYCSFCVVGSSSCQLGVPQEPCHSRCVACLVCLCAYYRWDVQCVVSFCSGQQDHCWIDACFLSVVRYILHTCVLCIW